MRSTHQEFRGRIGQSVSFTTGSAILASIQDTASGEVVEAAATVDVDACAPEDLGCLRATIGSEEDGNATAGIETVSVWDGHVRCRRGLGAAAGAC